VSSEIRNELMHELETFNKHDAIQQAFYRQLSGGNYHISLEQILQTARLRHMKLFYKLDDPSASKAQCDARECCKGELTEEELVAVDEIL
jgi:hypothetical protein